jgi:hypothetical protein
MPPVQNQANAESPAAEVVAGPEEQIPLVQNQADAESPAPESVAGPEEGMIELAELRGEAAASPATQV